MIMLLSVTQCKKNGIQLMSGCLAKKPKRCGAYFVPITLRGLTRLPGFAPGG
jgi:hypothetical protein